MKRLLGGILRWSGKGIMFLSTILVLVFGSVTLVLWFNGQLSAERLEKAYLAMKEGKKKEEVVMPQGVDRKEWEKIQKYGRGQHETINLEKRELSSMRDVYSMREQQNRLRGQEDETKWKKLADAQKKLKDDQDAWKQQQEDQKFQDNLAKYSAMDAELIVQAWRPLSDAQVIRYLRAMEADVVAEVHEAMFADPTFSLIAQGQAESRAEKITKLFQ